MTIKRYRAQSIAQQLRRLQAEQIPNAQEMVTRLQGQLTMLRARGAKQHEIETVRRRLADWVRDLQAFRKTVTDMRRLLQKRGPRY